MEENYYEVTEDNVEMIKKAWNKLMIPNEVRYKVVGSSKLKAGVKISKMNELQNYLSEVDIIIEINEDDLFKIGNELSEILIYQELCKIYVDMNNGKIKLNKPDLITFSSVVKKYGVDEVMKANVVLKAVQEEESTLEDNPFEEEIV